MRAVACLSAGSVQYGTACLRSATLSVHLHAVGRQGNVCKLHLTRPRLGQGHRGGTHAQQPSSSHTNDLCAVRLSPGGLLTGGSEAPAQPATRRTAGGQAVRGALLPSIRCDADSWHFSSISTLAAHAPQCHVPVQLGRRRQHSQQLGRQRAGSQAARGGLRSQHALLSALPCYYSSNSSAGVPITSNSCACAGGTEAPAQPATRQAARRRPSSAWGTAF